MGKKLAIITFSLFFILNFSPSVFSREKLTITTYYPSPHGVYSTLRLFPQDTPSGSCQEGEMYYDTEGIIKVCDSNGAWIDAINVEGSGAAATYWTLSGNELFPTDPTYDVGIGTDTPEVKLHVRGGELRVAAGIGRTKEGGEIQLVAKDGQTLRWNIDDDSSDNFRIFDNANVRFRLKPGKTGDIVLAETGGNVGIGTVRPAATLDVDGYLTIRGDAPVAFVNWGGLGLEYDTTYGAYIRAYEGGKKNLNIVAKDIDFITAKGIITINDNGTLSGNFITEGFVEKDDYNDPCNWESITNIGSLRTCFATNARAGTQKASGYEIYGQECKYDRSTGYIKVRVLENGCDETGDMWVGCEYVCFD
ncbi:MAG: hypothetical protein DRP74_07575 [Candidatus Omnitrophota bacterium]|nr:MAG: hypothetical protein DRP74_07575 [Candidatus Omnitrophota bacterium]